MLFISSYYFEQIVEAALQTYPQECCGFLLGFEENGERYVEDIITCFNESERKERAFVIAPKEYINAERKAEEKNLILLGIYHSHPDCEATPSATDLRMALPYFSYLIISVFGQKNLAAKSWRLNEQSVFEEEKVITDQTIISKNKKAYGNHNYSYTAS